MSLVRADQLPFGSAALPTNTQLSFLEAPLSQIVDGFVERQQAQGRVYTCQPALQESAAQSLARLRPLSFLGNRHLFVPTQSGWTAYFNDYPLGTNVMAFVPEVSAAISCRSLWITAIPWQAGGDDQEALGFHVTEPYSPAFRRSIGLRNTAGVWRFWRLGTPFDFEDLDRYQFRSRKRRFDLACLRQYVQALGLHPFDESFYLSGAVLVTRSPQAETSVADR